MSLRRLVLIALVLAPTSSLAADEVPKPVDKPATDGQQSFVPGGVAPSFVIPKNTCESGTPLQKLLTDKPDKTKGRNKARNKTKAEAQ